MWAQTRWKNRQIAMIYQHFADAPLLCFQPFTVWSSAWLIVSGLIRGSGSDGMWSVLPAGSELHGRFFYRTETQPLNHLTKMRQRADLSFVPNIPILKITCFTIKSVNWQDKTRSIHNNIRSWRRWIRLKWRTCFWPIISIISSFTFTSWSKLLRGPCGWWFFKQTKST